MGINRFGTICQAKRNLGGFYSTTTALFSLKITKTQQFINIII
ncbi:hypothetical protein T4B_7648 [Trichinella pseudospiralis]|uniref:Uncharacterized protein n=1 Tax=Trichinella pseudospiralis TaxID=6337 RepID=A0A0V1FPD5_TRIPS|nr:hypothetical protein T4B_7648 [Trichinella pseudospiralis]